MTIAITYNPTSTRYAITADGATLGSAEYYAAAYDIELAYREAQASAIMGGDPLLMPEGDWLDKEGW